jgi:3-hydroxyisobutyrate dehydrogenase-like beta-hydroxyacid dehydrogenase
MIKRKLSCGVIGLGIIGSRVAANVRDAGHTVYVWNRTPKPMPNFLGTPAQVAEQARVIQLFLRDDAAVLEVLKEMRPALTKQHLILNHATLSVKGTRAVADFCGSCEADFLDAPFTGSKQAAADGKLVYYVSGAEPLIERARSVLEASSSQILPMGEVGAATVVKLTTNLVTAAIVKALAEAVAITRSQGVPLDYLQLGFENNANFSKLIGMKLPAIRKGDFEAHFSLQNMLKDVDFNLQLAQEAGLETSVLAAVAEAMRGKLAEGRGDVDFSVLGEGLGDEEKGGQE